MRSLRFSALALILLTSKVAIAQQSPAPRSSWELRIPGGGLVSTGVQRDYVKDAKLTALQVSRGLNERLAVTGTLGWARSRDLSMVGAPKLDVFTSDVGLEVRSREWFADAPVSLSTFGGLGAGARSYNHRKLDVKASHLVAGYAAAGGELGIGRVGVRIEARDYATGLTSSARNDVVIMAGLRFNRRASEAR